VAAPFTPAEGYSAVSRSVLRLSWSLGGVAALLNARITILREPTRTLAVRDLVDRGLVIARIAARPSDRPIDPGRPGETLATRADVLRQVVLLLAGSAAASTLAEGFDP
jgi:hypothetical protein